MSPIEPDELHFSARKTLSIRIDSVGRLIVRAPKRYPEKRIAAFLEEKREWIEKKQAERKGAAALLPPENLDGYLFPILGKATRIQLVESSRIAYDSEAGVLFLPNQSPQKRLVAWLKSNAKRVFTAVTQDAARKMGVCYQSITVSSARTRWGSCSAENALRYTFRLLYCPKEIIEYVAVHELAHTRYKNHSPAFWQEVARYLPDWKLRRKWLKAHGVYMQIF